jgi:hypothetical protein
MPAQRRTLSIYRALRFDELVAKRQADNIIPEEIQKLILITNQIEQHDAQRLAALVERANPHGTTLDALMATLGVTPSEHV